MSLKKPIGLIEERLVWRRTKLLVCAAKIKAKF